MRIILESGNQSASLKNIEELKRLDAVLTVRDSLETIRGVRRVDGDHIWFDVAALEALAGPQPDQWHKGFAGMIAYATSKGWVDESLNAVRVHIASGD